MHPTPPRLRALARSRGRAEQGGVSLSASPQRSSELTYTASPGLGRRTNEPPLARGERAEVRPRLRQAEVAVRPAADLVGIGVILPVVLPEADGADVVASALRKRQAAA